MPCCDPLGPEDFLPAGEKAPGSCSSSAFPRNCTSGLSLSRTQDYRAKLIAYTHCSLASSRSNTTKRVETSTLPLKNQIHFQPLSAIKPKIIQTEQETHRFTPSFLPEIREKRKRRGSRARQVLGFRLWRWGVFYTKTTRGRKLPGLPVKLARRPNNRPYYDTTTPPSFRRGLLHGTYMVGAARVLSANRHCRRPAAARP